MKLTKSSVTYKGKEYPTVLLDTTVAEALRHDFLIKTVQFGTSAMLSDFPQSESDWGEEENDVDGEIDYYLGTGDIEGFCEGDIPESTMKMTLGRLLCGNFGIS